MTIPTLPISRLAINKNWENPDALVKLVNVYTEEQINKHGQACYKAAADNGKLMYIPDDGLPPIETPVMILHNGKIKVSSVEQEEQSFEEGGGVFSYWDGGIDLQDVYFWMHIPTKMRNLQK